jgi:Zn-finger nucleic acid-binding protein
MKCPACFNPLTQYQIGAVTIDVCNGGCGGLWLDAFELRRLESETDAGDGAFPLITRDANVRVDPQRKRDCPRCDDVKLKRRFFSPKRKVEIDECPGCGGLWLDAGELERIHDELEESRATSEAQDRQPLFSMAVIRQIYRLRLAQRGEGA